MALCFKNYFDKVLSCALVRQGLKTILDPVVNEFSQLQNLAQSIPLNINFDSIPLACHLALNYVIDDSVPAVNVRKDSDLIFFNEVVELLCL